MFYIANSVSFNEKDFPFENGFSHNKEIKDIFRSFFNSSFTKGIPHLFIIKSNCTNSDLQLAILSTSLGISVYEEVA